MFKVENLLVLLNLIDISTYNYFRNATFIHLICLCFNYLNISTNFKSEVILVTNYFQLIIKLFNSDLKWERLERVVILKEALFAKTKVPV